MSTASWVKQATSASGTVIDVPLDISFSPKYVDFSAANIYPGQGFIYTIESGPTKEIGFGKLKTGTPWILVREQVVEVCVNGRIERRDSKLNRIDMKPGSIITLGNGAYTPFGDVPRHNVDFSDGEVPKNLLQTTNDDFVITANTWVGTVFNFESTTAVPFPLPTLLTINVPAVYTDITAFTCGFYIIDPGTGYAERAWDEIDLLPRISGGTNVSLDIDPPTADGDSIIFYPGYYVFAIGMSSNGTTGIAFNGSNIAPLPAWLGGNCPTTNDSQPATYFGTYNAVDKLPAVLNTFNDRDPPALVVSSYEPYLTF